MSIERVQQIAQIDNSVDSANSNYVYVMINKLAHHSPYFNILIGNSDVSMMTDSGASVNMLTDVD